MWNQYKEPNPNLHHQFVDDIIAYNKEKQEVGHDVLLAFDANNLITAASVHQILHECGMYDLMEVPDTDPDKQLQDTFIHGKAH